MCIIWSYSILSIVRFVRVCSLVGRYFLTMYITEKVAIVFSFNVKDNNTFPCLHYVRHSYNISYINASVLCQSECACLHTAIYMAFYFVQKPTQKEEHSCKCTELYLHVKRE